MRQFYVWGLQVVVFILKILVTGPSIPGVFPGGEAKFLGCFDPYLRYTNNNGYCVCPNEYPVRKTKNDVNKCCTNILNTSNKMECKCDFSHAYHSPTDDCYEIQLTDLTIQVNGQRICPDENFKPKNGQGCCRLNEQNEKFCICKSKEESYSHFSDKCKPIIPF